MNERSMFDIGKVMDEVFGAAQSFSETFSDAFRNGPNMHHARGPWSFFNENVDFYPAFNYPPANVYITGDKQLIFEFALAGFDEKDIDLKFHGDYMVLSARIPMEMNEREGVRYFKRRLKLKDIEGQRYYAPADKFDRENVKAVFKRGILRVELPPKEDPSDDEAIRIDIEKEGE
ncbi:MAG TPA: Hsp20/alpha crystallin family protein [Spirochaetia bacterium]|nr:Hsp20/alpha crystallin family protein [Spirochaetia bacterium]